MLTPRPASTRASVSEAMPRCAMAVAIASPRASSRARQARPGHRSGNAQEIAIERPVFSESQHDSRLYARFEARRVDYEVAPRVFCHRRNATSAQIASTMPNGHAPLRNP